MPTTYPEPLWSVREMFLFVAIDRALRARRANGYADDTFTLGGAVHWSAAPSWLPWVNTLAWHNLIFVHRLIAAAPSSAPIRFRLTEKGEALLAQRIRETEEILRGVLDRFPKGGA